MLQVAVGWEELMGASRVGGRDMGACNVGDTVNVTMSFPGTIRSDTGQNNRISSDPYSYLLSFWVVPGSYILAQRMPVDFF